VARPEVEEVSGEEETVAEATGRSGEEEALRGDIEEDGMMGLLEEDHHTGQGRPY